MLRRNASRHLDHVHQRGGTETFDQVGQIVAGQGDPVVVGAEDVPDMPDASPRIVRRGLGSRFMYMPIVDAVHAIVDANAAPEDEIARLQTEQ